MSKEKKQNNDKRINTIIKNIWIIFGSVILFSVLLFLSISMGWLGFMPSFEELENPKSNLASEVYSADQVLLGKYYIENRSNISYSELSPCLVQALIATEDARFYDHSGIDVRALTRAVTAALIGGNAGGGSTITQQLAKNLFPRGTTSKPIVIIQKLKEWVIAVKLEYNYTKEEILAMYLNTVTFGSNSYGIKTAAKTYFGKTPAELNRQEASMLVGMLKAPSYYNPARNLERAKTRRNTVLDQQLKYDYITNKECDSLKALPVDMSKYQKEDHKDGSATYFREYLRNYLQEWCKTHVKADGTHYNLYSDGLKIYTTINSKMQKYAEEAVAEHIGKNLQPEFYKHWANKKAFPNAPFYRITKEEKDKILDQSMKRSDRYHNMKRNGENDEIISKSFNTPTEMTLFSWKGDIDTTMTPMDSILYYKYFLQTGMMAIEPNTGFVRVYVGGIDYRYFQYDHVTVAKRQIGSTFKPFIYASAMQELGYTPCTTVPNVPVTFEMPGGQPPYTPKNSDDAREGQMVTLKWALANSVNYVSAFLIKRVKPAKVIEIARKMGITSDIDPVPSICLGTPSISVAEMVGATATYPNKGVYQEPIFISRIEDKSGNILETFSSKATDALDEKTAYLMLDLMKGVVESGTGMRLRYKYGLNYPIAGKTGTTDNNSDGWFLGLTPDLVTGVWVGAEDRSVHFRSTSLGQGANMALPIWAIFMKKVYADSTLKISKGDFDRPPSMQDFNCSDKGTNVENTNEEFDF